MRRRPKWNDREACAPAGRPANLCRALMPVDGSAIRKKLQRDYEKTKRDLAEAQRQLDHFQRVDVPEFSRWFNGHFGALLTETREWQQKMAANAELILEVQDEMFYGGGSEASAYQRVMAARENPAPAPGPPKDGGPANPHDPWFEDAPPPDRDFDEDSGRPRNPFEELFEGLFGESGPDGDFGGEPGPWDRHRPAPMARPADAARLKDLYRRLVRRLHPDTQAEMTPQKTEWWHQAQAAYTAGNADQLEVILTLCENGEAGVSGQTSASLLHRLTAQLRGTLRQIKRQLGNLRHDDAWNFSGRKDHAKLEVVLRRKLTEQLKALRADWNETEQLIARWKAAAERLKKAAEARRAKGRKKRAAEIMPEGIEMPF